MESVKFTGHCFCGDLAFEFPKSDIQFVAHCHCNICREWTGTAMISACVIKSDLTWTKGKPSMFKKEGHTKTKVFCGKCGTGIINGFAEGGGGVKLGVIDNNKEIFTGDLAPKFHIQVQGKVPWCCVDADKLVQHQEWPPQPKDVPKDAPKEDKPKEVQLQEIDHLMFEWTVKEEHQARFVELFKKACAASRLEKDCIRYDLMQQNNDKTKFVLFEAWKKGGWQEPHLKQQYIVDIFALFKEIGIAPNWDYRLTAVDTAQ